MSTLTWVNYLENYYIWGDLAGWISNGMQI